ncbi:diguanylate cyclase domain-containing protein [Anaerobacillus isosaccharinicus]|uniref:Diguanylate cyclase n=1 Tax=Anaerobacillus isosaccharinicus TaxID=1532552 RepID=A0A1S2LRC4_9BACI|nr:diguanylate cyclase [Anaerobacillus isosaccharinicus]MBA5585430.1 diguanylate cyclase [Anaerobacillus isosaccharinicus]QOY36252.1 diguanylate cyclase [Anaerobacillus isosaccharinicus]
MDQTANIYEKKIEELKKREQELINELVKKETLYEKILDSLPINIFVEDKQGRTIFANKRACDCNKMTREEVQGKTVFDLFPRVIAEKVRQEDLEVWETKQFLTKETVVKFQESEVHMYNGKTIIHLDDSFDGEYLLGFGLDITARKRAEQQIEHMAYHDNLTNLPNRWYIHKFLADFMEKNKDGEHTITVFVLDIDHFKVVNDNFGHLAGDKLLQEVSRRLQKLFSPSFTIARWGGDEFIILAPNLESENDIITISESIKEMMEDPFSYENQVFNVTTSIGISLFPFHGTDINTLLKNADSALYCSKENGRNGYELYHL